jgi:ElaB/YqjD/DUF883 family membrane-anchored ribosome-binding protein
MPQNGRTSDFRDVKDQTKEQAQQLKDQVRELVGAGQDKVNEVKTKLIDAKDRAVQRAEGAREQLTDKIKSNPLAAVGIAFGIGYLAMRIFRR